ncbi:3-methyl-2-oxobutanoate hydroxymethyltransferase [Acidisphaera sp. S103]|uniref:3-methyl-2-oxobutanoate hydroxymethyltransferase n=1 Tax=Acidisphaera sp. S103 TaxID=1747223 RepID=UPI00131AB77F|nr:3-methyl-2-oxobutanoate hydroxymethyltransferase [Acidisphaera sp. S103]
MSKQVVSRRVTVPDILALKGRQKIVSLTAYTAPVAALLDPHVDFLLVGDSVGMVVHGLPTPTAVTLEMMILHGQAVVRGSSHALVVVDLPFGSFEGSPEQAYAAAVRVMKETGCQAVKIEAGEALAGTVAFLVQRGVPVMGHVGLRPQAVHVDGGFKAKGRNDDERARVIAEARAVDEAGCFAIVLEGVSEALAAEITGSVRAPTIGIGASPKCDGQILVTDDMLGVFEWTPKFVRRYADLRGSITDAVSRYAADVRAVAFPGDAEVYRFKAKE